MRRIGGAALVLVASAMAVGCSGSGPEPPDAEPSADPTAAPVPSETPTPEPAVDAIRGVDFGELTWVWDTIGVRFDAPMAGGVAVVTDGYYEHAEVQITVGDPVYSDANGDGLLDAAVPGVWESSNGISEKWYVWLAQEDDPENPQQVLDPIAVGSRCADNVNGVTAIEGGFRVDETMRSTLEQDNACPEEGTMQRTREVGIVGDGTGEGSWPATLDGKGWGGYCPVREYTEGYVNVIDGARVAPSDDAPESTLTGEQLHSPMQVYPVHQPAEWQIFGVVPDPDPEGDDSLICLWAKPGH